MDTETEVEYLTCEDCGDDQIESGDEYSRDGRTVCSDCDDNYTTCDDCSTDVHHDDEVATDNGSVCESCSDIHYFDCNECERRVHNDASAWVAGDEVVCDSCRDSYYYYCDRCDDYYHQHAEHYHDDDCDCVAPGQSFTVNNGDATLGNDERLSLTLPDGFLSDVGMGQIANIVRELVQRPSLSYVLNADGNYFRDEFGNTVLSEDYIQWRAIWDLSYGLADAIGSEWQNKGGNFTKRLSRHLYQTAKFKIDPTVLSAIGNIGRDHSKGSDVNVEFTRDLNQSADDFYHGGSCWWTEYSESRCALKSNGGIGLRTFKSVPVRGYITRNGEQVYGDTGQTYSVVSGRAWVMPVNGSAEAGWKPTFDSTDADGYVIFNGYGDLDGYAAARIVSMMNGMTYRRISFDCDPMYVNGEAGYLVTSEALAAAYDSNGRISLNTDTHSNLYNDESTRALVNA